MNHTSEANETPVAELLNATGQAQILLVCEHASNFIPSHLESLGLSDDDLISHAAWDPGALAVATKMAQFLDAPLVTSRISRLVYDCNRPPTADDAMPERSEVIDVPGNAGLTKVDQQTRIDAYYMPFRTLLARTIETREVTALVTIHSFTPVYQGQPRSVEIGLLHDADTRLADAMLESAATQGAHDVQRNAPYGPKDGVTHTLKEHALPLGISNVMIEVRNDLIRDAAKQEEMALLLSRWVRSALDAPKVAQCKA